MVQGDVMNYNNLDVYFDRYKKIIDEISLKKNYDSNLKHLLYVIMTAFVFKYDLKCESNIIDCFKKTRIIFGETNLNISAFFDRKLLFYNNNYYTDKYILIGNTISNNYIKYIDTIINELNHAVNSIKNEVKEDTDKIYLRTGLSYSIYKKDTNIGIGKTNEYILEEIINTKQTEEIINIILKFSEQSVSDIEISNMLQSIKREINSDNYRSEAYQYESLICKDMLNNKTFYVTLEKLRFDGKIDDIIYWFDNIVGREGSYKELNNLLYVIHNLEIDYSKKKLFKKNILRKIKSNTNRINDIVTDFNNNCIYK